MNASDWGTWLAAAFTAVSAGGVIWGAKIAKKAASTWLGVHKHAKADEYIAASFDLTHAVNQFISERLRLQNGPHLPGTPVPFPGGAYDAAWTSWRRLQVAHVVAYRYYARFMDRAMPDRLAVELDALKTWSNSIPRNFAGQGVPFDQAAFNAAEIIGDGIKGRVRREAEAIDAALMPSDDREADPVHIGRPGLPAWLLPKL